MNGYKVCGPSLTTKETLLLPVVCREVFCHKKTNTLVAHKFVSVALQYVITHVGLGGKIT